MYSTNEPLYRREKTHVLGEQICGCQGGGGGSGMDWEFAVRRYKLLHLEWMISYLYYIYAFTGEPCHL